MSESTDAVAFLRALFPELPEGVFMELRVISEGRPMQEWFTDPADLLTRGLALANTHDVYFGVNPRRGRSGKKDDVAFVGALHVDHDQEREEAYATLRTFRFSPSAVIASGHGLHMYWLLREPCTIESPTDVERVEGLTRGLAHRLDGDTSAWDISRVLRLPGTVSHKRGGATVELVEFHADRRYDLSDFEEWGLDVPAGAAPVEFDGGGIDPAESLKKAEVSLSLRTYRLITEGHTAGADRSRDDFGVCCELARAGLSDDEIQSIFRKFAIGEKYRERDAGDAYLARTIGNARRETEAEAPGLPRDKPGQRDALRRAKQTVAHWLLLDDDRVVDVALGTVVANAAEGDPVWLVIVAGSSSAKTEIIRSLSECPQVYPLSSLTDKTFASGLGDPSQNSLLKKIKSGQTLTFKDFGSILAMRPDAKAEVLGQLREIYDGRYRKAFGTGKELDWEGRIGFLTASTPAIERQHSVIGELGERFLWYRMETPIEDREAVAAKALDDTGQETRMREEISQAFLDVIGTIDPETAASVQCGDAERTSIGVAGNLCTWLRTPVSRDYRSRTIDYQPKPEGPARMVKALLRLGRGLAAIRGDEAIGTETLQLVLKVALDSVPPKRLSAARYLAERGWVKTRAIGLALGLPTTTATYLLEDLHALQVVEKQIEGGGSVEDESSNRSFEWRLHAKVSELLGRLHVENDQEATL